MMSESEWTLNDSLKMDIGEWVDLMDVTILIISEISIRSIFMLFNKLASLLKMRQLYILSGVFDWASIISTHLKSFLDHIFIRNF
jgi:hypothetical protein